MAEEIVLEVKPREVKGKQVRALRRQGIVPIALYGGHIAPAALQAEERPLRAVMNKAGHNRLIRLGGLEGDQRLVIMREIQREPISGRLLHVDLQEISLTEKMTTDVPIVLRGNAPAVSRGEGLLIHGIDLLTIRVLPTELIPEVEVDVTGLDEVGQTIHVSDLKLAAQIEVLTDSTEMVARVIPVKEEVVAVEAPTAVAEVEVVGKGKKEEEGEAEAPAAPAKKEETK